MTKKPIQQHRPSAGAGSRIYSRDNVARYSERAKDRKRSTIIRRTVICAIVLALVGGVGAAALTFAKSVINGRLMNNSVITSQVLDILKDTNASKEPFYVLLLGTDGRPGDTSYRSDSIILARVDPTKKNATLISIPRDTKVTYKGEIMKINATHSYDGAEGVISAVNELCGVQISYYAEINFDGMKQLVDSVGGIDLYIPEGDEVDDGAAGPVKVDSGQQHLDGEAALTFSRARHQFADGDYTRMRHQRMVMGALANKILNNMDVTKIPSLLDSLSNMLITNMSVDDIVSVITAMKGMNVDDIWSANLPSWAGADTYINGVSYVFVKEDELKAMMERVDAGKDPQGPQTMSTGSSGSESATLGDLSKNSTKDWSNGTATTSGSSSSGSSSDSDNTDSSSN